ncbi:hypothetical protein D6856_09885 [Butyrivibrio sp. XB500-5]|uniref:TylF/MycF/NovP-related O-methyltransferase n=1 Tax=Butyrivibrio sp. XB500-5 TaxID=2364880 RepID=UPI000EAAA28D|nr:TylF/MycF/NovP-related O-methyltransferase [Butyrivibrio sp. XB500-5]RKM59518.1 hypothetical protein D6856_09885 [Butyrivibrio sp. XB500-5]
MKVLIWGCGDYGRKIVPQLMRMNDIEIVGYTDSNEMYWGKKLGMFRVFSPSEIVDLDVDQILVAVSNPVYSHSIMESIEKMGIEGVSIIDVFCDDFYFDLLIDQRINFIRGYSKWIYSNNILGNVAECGVFRGDSAKYINKYFPDRKLFLCDTFEGFSKSDLKNEIENSNVNFLESRFADRNFFEETSVDLVMKKMPYPEKVVIKQGYFPESMEGVSDKFAFVNLDMDLYIPMYEGLKFFWNKMAEGGCILLHDYFSDNFIRVKDAVYDFENELGEKLIKVPIGDDCSLAIIRN